MKPGISITGNTTRVFTHLEELKLNFDVENGSKLHTFCEVLAELGRVEAEELYNIAAAVAGDQAPTIDSAQWLDDKTLILTASGIHILFLEFGTGILNFSNTYPTDTLDAARNAQQFYGSSWSATHSKWLVEPKVSKYHGWWPWHGKWVSGNPPAKAMYEAGKTMRENMEEVVKRVFGE